MKIKPMGDNVFLVDQNRERVSPGGIIIPDTVESEFGGNAIACRVIATGPGGYGYSENYDETIDERGALVPNHKRKLKYWPMEVEEGELVLVDRLAGEMATIGDELSPQSGSDFEAGQKIRIVRCS